MIRLNNKGQGEGGGVGWGEFKHVEKPIRLELSEKNRFFLLIFDIWDVSHFQGHSMDMGLTSKAIGNIFQIVKEDK